MTGGNTYHHAIRIIYRGTGFYAAVAVIADLFLVAALFSSYAVVPHRPAAFSSPSHQILQAQLQPQISIAPESSDRLPVPDTEEALVSTETEEAAVPAIEETERGTPENGQMDGDGEDPSVSPEKDAAAENFIALKDFINLSVNRGDSGRNYGVAGGSCEAEVLAAAGRPDGCLKLTYDVSAAPAAIAGYSGALDGVDFTLYRLLTFQVKKVEGREPFAVEISDGMSAAKVEINRLLPDEGYQGWQTITIPLEYFSGIDAGHGARGRISVIFENSQGEPYAGTVFLRDIGFKR